MRISILTTLFLASAMPVWAQSRGPYAGFLYPSGGQRGKTVQIAVGGSQLSKAKTVMISGDGVTGKVVKHYRYSRMKERDNRKDAGKRLKEEINKRKKDPTDPNDMEEGLADATEAITMLEALHDPYYTDFQKLSTAELRQVAKEFHTARMKKQENRQLAERLIISVTIDKDAKPGYRELRLATGAAVSNPMRFYVGSLNEYREREPNGPEIKDLTPLAMPVTINGQIMPGDIDRFAIKAKAGQQLVIDVHARRLVPYLADAVPGWFQATAALYDSNGKEVAFNDDFRFNPDPAIFFRVPADGTYVLEIRDSIYRGREDFVYRMRIGELPFVTSAFPLGGRAGKPLNLRVGGLNMTEKRLKQAKATAGIQWVSATKDGVASNPVPYLADEFSSVFETPDNNSAAKAQAVKLPMAVNGRIAPAGDVDVFTFSGKAGMTVSLEVIARRLNSSLDSLLRIYDKSGKVIAWNDDYKVRNTGLVTHNSDSYVLAKLPADGDYFVHVLDAQNHGGPAHGYRLRMRVAKPEYELYVTPSGINVPAGKTVPIQAFIIRKGGFKGPVSVSLDKAPGFKLAGGFIPVGTDKVVMTLTSPKQGKPKPMTLAFKGTATVGGTRVARTAIPADDVMQAFLWRHLVESEKTHAVVSRAGAWMPTYHWNRKKPIRLAPGSTVLIEAVSSRPIQNGKVEFALHNPPKGVSMKTIEFKSKYAVLKLSVDKVVKPGLETNLIVQMTGEFKARPRKKGKGKAKAPAAKGKDDKKDAKAKKPKVWRVPLGAIPALRLTVEK